MRLVARADVLAHQHLVAHIVLEDDAEAAAQRIHIPIGQVAAIEEDAAGGWHIQPRQQLDQRGLARAVRAYQRQAATRLQMQRDIRQRGTIGARIRE